MIQGGDPLTKNRDPRDDGQGDPGFRLQDEINDVAHARGIVSMANSGRPNSAGSQFFIVVADRPDLNGGYTVFGRVVAGMAVVDRIVATPRDEFGRHGPPDRPTEDVVIESMRIEPGHGAAAGGDGATSSAPPSVSSGPPILGIDLDSTVERAGQPAPLEHPAPTEPAERRGFAE
jgi:cyclophilin family peptidyl-prolyl cis-trans isomerase